MTTRLQSYITQLYVWLETSPDIIYVRKAINFMEGEEYFRLRRELDNTLSKSTKLCNILSSSLYESETLIKRIYELIKRESKRRKVPEAQLELVNSSTLRVLGTSELMTLVSRIEKLFKQKEQNKNVILDDVQFLIEQLKKRYGAAQFTAKNIEKPKGKK